MEINENYLNGKDYLEGKTTKDISALNLQGVSPTAPVTVPDLISALVSKQTPHFDSLTNLEGLKQLLDSTSKTNTTSQEHAIDKSNELVTKAIEYAMEKAKQDTMEKAIEKGINPYVSTNKNTNTKSNTDPSPSPTPNPNTDPSPNPTQNPNTDPSPNPIQNPNADPNSNPSGSLSANTSDFANFFEDVNIDEFGFSGLSQDETNRYRCLMALVAAGGDKRFSVFKEYKRLQNKMLEYKGAEELKPEHHIDFAIYAGAMIDRYGISKTEIIESADFIIKKFGLDSDE